MAGVIIVDILLGIIVVIVFFMILCSKKEALGPIVDDEIVIATAFAASN